MNDIELRWGFALEMVDDSTIREIKVLQYRKQIRNTSASNELSGIVTEWSEWIDVPIVKET